MGKYYVIEKHANQVFQEIVDIRRRIHANPELSELEFETADFICDFLEKNNIEYKRNIAGNGVVGIIRGLGERKNKKEKTVALRADMDALPIVEKNNVSYCSKNYGIMHACGHDGHIAMLLGTAKILKNMENEFEGNVKLIFQPAEETVGGAERMIKEGCLDKPKVDYVLGVHLQPYLEAGQIELKYGHLTAETYEISLKVYGKSSHGAHPEKGVDAIVIAANIINALQAIVSREVCPLEPVVLSLGKIKGGTKNNILCDCVEIDGILRTFSREQAKLIIEKIKDVSNGISGSFLGNCEIKIKKGYKGVVNDRDVINVIRKIGELTIGSENVLIRHKPNLEGEDFSYYAREDTKTALYYVGCGNENCKIKSPLHSDTFDICEDGLKTGVIIQTASALELLNIQ